MEINYSKKLDATANQIEGLQQQSDRLLGVLEKSRSELTRLQSNQKERLDLSIEETHFAVSRSKQELQDLFKEQEKVEIILPELGEECRKTFRRKCKAELNLDSFTRVQHERLEQEKKIRLLLEQLSHDYVWDVDHVDLSKKESVRDLMSRLTNLYGRAKHEKTVEQEKKYGPLQIVEEEIRQLGNERFRLESEIKLIQTQVNQLEQDLSNSQIRMKGSEKLQNVDEEKVEKFRVEIKHLEDKMKQIEQENVIHEIHTRIQNTIHEMEDSTKKSKSLLEKIDEHKPERERHTKFFLLEQEVRRKSDLVAEMLREILPTLQKYSIQDQDVALLSESYYAICTTLEKSHKKKEHERREKEQSCLIQQQALKEIGATLVEKRALFSEKQDALFQTLGAEGEKSLEGFARELEEHTCKEKQAWETISACTTHLKIIDEHEHFAETTRQCLTCSREFKDPMDLSDFIDRRSQSKNRWNRKLQEERDRYTILMKRGFVLHQLQEDYFECVRFQKETLICLETLLNTHTDKFALLKAELVELENNYTTSLAELTELRELDLQFRMLKQHNAELLSLETQIAPMRREIKAEEGSTWENLTLAYNETQNTIQKRNETLRQLWAHEEDLKKKQEELREHCFHKQREYVKLQDTLNRRHDWTIYHDSLNAQIRDHHSNINALEHRCRMICVDQEEALSRQKQFLVEYQRQHETTETEIKTLSSHYDTIQDALRRMLINLAADSPSQIEEAREELKTATSEHAKQDTVEKQQRRRSQELTELLKAEQDLHQKLQNSLEIRNTEHEIEGLRKQIQVVEDKIAHFQQSHLSETQLLGVDPVTCPPHERLWNLREKCRHRFSQIQQELSRLKGFIEPVLSEIYERKQGLSQEKYVDIEKRLTFAQIQLHTFELTCTDIDQYAKCLDACLMEYHADKMAELNESIENLWHDIYMGSDIDTIQIRCDEELFQTSTARRNFRYRVVMRKGEVELDLRGRCSAGQKVLASVIIRLALSDIFCCECGVLVLDEPTTNLDDQNIISLAQALRILIEKRREQRNFQLVLITHDEQFVRELGEYDFFDEFYRVHKSEDGNFSIIDRRSASDLFTS